MKKIYTTDQVAEFLQIHPLTVLNYIKTKQLKAIKLGRVYRIREADLEQFLQSKST